MRKELNHVTEDQVKAALESQLEDTEIPAKVLAWVEKNQGKKLRTNNVPEGTSISHSYGSTRLVTEDYYRHQGNKGFCFSVSGEVTHVVVPTPEEWQSKNIRYYRAAEERNSKRREVLDSSENLERVTHLLNSVADASNTLIGLVQELNGEPDTHTLKELIGFDPSDKMSFY